MTVGRTSRLSGAAERMARVLGRRAREAAFWRIQAMVLLVTALHVLLEARPLDINILQQMAPSLQHVPVGLYVIPVTYAGFVYGLEGGVLTGLWCGLLASANIPFFHRAEFEWVAELSFILVVIGVGVVTSIPVERERRQRQSAESVARRLAMLNEVTQAGLRPWGVPQTAEAILARVVGLLDAQGACLALWRRENDEMVVFASQAADGSSSRALEARLCAPAQERPTVPDGTIRETGLASGGLRGILCVCLGSDQEPFPEMEDFLVTVGSQLTISIENALLHQQERELLESYVQLVTRAQEEERKHIARELHDGAAQELTVLYRGLNEMTTSGRESDTDELIRLREMAESVLGELRRFGRDLRPALLDDLGLIPALEWLLSDLAERTTIRSGLDISGRVRRLDPEAEVGLFRIIQEALRNVEKHARATRVDVDVRFRPDAVIVSVGDDGCGFEVPEELGSLVPSGRLGLMGVRERAQLLRGNLELTSEPGGGTRVTARIPS